MIWLFFLMSMFSFGLSLKEIPEENSKLLLVQTLFRHGDRSPLILYPNDPNTESCCPEGLGKLSLLGRRQQYAVGKYLRSRYKNFITSDPKEISVYSSSVDRCMRSAEANVASLFAPEGIWKFQEDLNWQPIPIHNYIEDKYLHFASCPRAVDEAVKLYVSEGVQSFFQSNRKAFDELALLAGFDTTTELDPMDFYDTIKAERIHNLTIPSWVDSYWPLLETSAELLFRCFFSSQQLLRLRAGPLLQKLTDNMEGKLNGTFPDLKLQVFSSHDNVVGAMLLALTSTYMPRPPYCATLVFELHQLQDQSGVVRVLYLNSTTPEIDVGEPHPLTLKGCSEFCPLDKFAMLMKPLIPLDWDAECQQQDTGRTSKVDHRQKPMLQHQYRKYFFN